MKFGKKLLSERVSRFKNDYVDYERLKQLIYRLLKEPDSQLHVAKVMGGAIPAGESARVSVFMQRWEGELRKVNKCVVRTDQEATRGIDHLLTWLDNMGDDADESELLRVEQSADLLSALLVDLHSYLLVNALAFHKIAKKAAKNFAEGKLMHMLDTRLYGEPLMTTRFGPKLVKLSAVYAGINALRSAARGAGADEKWVPPASFERQTLKFFVPSQYEIAVKTRILKHLPILVFDAPKEQQERQQQTARGALHFDSLLVDTDEAASGSDASWITSCYLDNAALDAYHTRLKKIEGATLVRLRNYGLPVGRMSVRSPVFVERKTHHESWVRANSIKERFQLDHWDDAARLINGELDLEPYLRRRLADEADEAKRAQSLELALAVQREMRKRALRPALYTTYRRTAFQLATSNKVRITMDVDLAMTLEKGHSETPRGHWHVANLLSVNAHGGTADTFPFPHAVLEVKLQEGFPEWLEDILNEDYVVLAEGFSKFLTGTAVFHQGQCQLLPPTFTDDPSVIDAVASWRKEFHGGDSDVARPGKPRPTSKMSAQRRRTLKERTLQEVRAASPTARPTKSMTGKKKKKTSSSSGGADDDDDDDDDYEEEWLAEPLSSTEQSPVASLRRRKQATSGPSSARSRTATAGGGGGDVELGQVGAADSTSSSGKVRKKMFGSRSGKSGGKKSGGGGSSGGGGGGGFKQLLNGRPAPTGGQRAAKVEPKTFFANERTFLQWFSAAVFIIAIIPSLPDVFEGGGAFSFLRIVLPLFAVALLLYGLAQFQWRLRQIRANSPDGYSDPFGPCVLVVLLIVLIAIIIYGHAVTLALSDGAAASDGAGGAGGDDGGLKLVSVRPKYVSASAPLDCADEACLATLAASFVGCVQHVALRRPHVFTRHVPPLQRPLRLTCERHVRYGVAKRLQPAQLGLPPWLCSNISLSYVEHTDEQLLTEVNNRHWTLLLHNVNVSSDAVRGELSRLRVARRCEELADRGLVVEQHSAGAAARSLAWRLQANCAAIEDVPFERVRDAATDPPVFDSIVVASRLVPLADVGSRHSYSVDGTHVQLLNATAVVSARCVSNAPCSAAPAECAEWQDAAVALSVPVLSGKNRNAQLRSASDLLWPLALDLQACVHGEPLAPSAGCSEVVMSRSFAPASSSLGGALLPPTNDALDARAVQPSGVALLRRADYAALGSAAVLLVPDIGRLLIVPYAQGGETSAPIDAIALHGDDVEDVAVPVVLGAPEVVYVLVEGSTVRIKAVSLATRSVERSEVVDTSLAGGARAEGLAFVCDTADPCAAISGGLFYVGTDHGDILVVRFNSKGTDVESLLRVAQDLEQPKIGAMASLTLDAERALLIVFDNARQLRLVALAGDSSHALTQRRVQSAVLPFSNSWEGVDVEAVVNDTLHLLLARDTPAAVFRWQLSLATGQFADCLS